MQPPPVDGMFSCQCCLAVVHKLVFAPYFEDEAERACGCKYIMNECYVQGIIQSAFLWGYIGTTGLGGSLADKYGGGSGRF